MSDVVERGTFRIPGGNAAGQVTVSTTPTILGGSNNLISPAPDTILSLERIHGTILHRTAPTDANTNVKVALVRMGNPLAPGFLEDQKVIWAFVASHIIVGTPSNDASDKAGQPFDIDLTQRRGNSIKHKPITQGEGTGFGFPSFAIMMVASLATALLLDLSIDWTRQWLTDDGPSPNIAMEFEDEHV